MIKVSKGSTVRTSVAAALVLLAGACGSDATATDTTLSTTSVVETSSTTELETTTSSTTTSSTTTSTTTTDDAATETTVAVYWSWSVPTISAGTPERLGTGGREATSPADALQSLLGGPNALENEIGMGTNIPDGTELLNLDIANSRATVDLSSTFEESGGTLGETFRLGQVVFTLTQFADVDTVDFRIDGVDRTEIGSHGIDVSAGLTRDDFTDIRALITLEGPYPGTAVADPFRITGESNTFEAGIEWTLVDDDGLILAEGFGTADAGNGTWGRFNLEIDVPDGTTGNGGILVYDTSARDGAQENIVEYPIVFSP